MYAINISIWEELTSQLFIISQSLKKLGISSSYLDHSVFSIVFCTFLKNVYACLYISVYCIFIHLCRMCWLLIFIHYRNIHFFMNFLLMVWTYQPDYSKSFITGSLGFLIEKLDCYKMEKISFFPIPRPSTIFIILFRIGLNRNCVRELLAFC